MVCPLLPQLFDIDEDNSITMEEFSGMLRSALGVCDLNVSSLFDEIDVDGSGHITYGTSTIHLRLYLGLIFMKGILNSFKHWNMNICVWYAS